MSVSFTIKNKKSLNFQYKDQDDLSLSSTIGGESVDITIGQPQIFDTTKTTITDAVTLDDITKDANLRYVADEAVQSPNDKSRKASGAAFRTHKQFSSSGDAVRFWDNAGTDEGMDLIQPWSYPTKPGAPDDDIHCPVWDNDDADNPFTNGAFKFSIDQTDTGYIDALVWAQNSGDVREEIRNVRSHKYFYFGNYKSQDAQSGELDDFIPGDIADFSTFSTGSGAYTVYAVYSQSGIQDQTYYSPLWTPIRSYGEDADTRNPIAQGGKVLQRYSNAMFYETNTVAKTSAFTLKDGTRLDTNTPNVVRATNSHSFTAFQSPTTQSVASGEIQIYVFTYTGNTDDNFSFFDIDSKNIVNEKKGSGAGVFGGGGGTSCNVFGSPERMAYAFQVGSASDSEYKPAYNGSSIFVAEFGYFDKALDGQTAASLCRLLKEKYKVD